MKIDQIDDKKLDHYKKACENISESLEYYWFLGEEKLASLILELENLGGIKINTNFGSIDFNKLISDLKDSKEGINQQILRIQSHFISPSEQKVSYINSDFNLVKSELDEAKTNILLALQGFVAGSGNLPSDPQEAINFLWRNYREVNLKNRYENEPNYKTAMNSSREEKERWFNRNERHLLSSYDSIFSSIVQMRNLQDHFKKNPFAREQFRILKTSDVEEPILGLPSRLVNTVDLIAGIILEISGIIRLIQIFLDTIKITTNGGIPRSEPSPTRP